MPYSSNADLPAAAGKYSDHCKSVFRRVFNDTHSRSGDEGRAFAAAHTAARKCQEAQKSMPDENAVETATPKSAQFKIFSGALTPYDGGDGRKRLRTIASSSVEDLGGDVVTPEALQRMAESAKGMTIFRNHSYKVPQDILGTTEKAEIRHAGTDGHGKAIYDLVLDVVLMDSPENNQTYSAVTSGVKLGTSIGAMIPEGAARKGDNGGYIFDELRLLEASIVGIPQNPRSWVEYAASAIELTEDEDEDTNKGFRAYIDGQEVEKAKVWVTVDTEDEAPEEEAETKDAETVIDKTAELAEKGEGYGPGVTVTEASTPALTHNLMGDFDPASATVVDETGEPDLDIQASDNLLRSGAGEESPAQEGDAVPESADADAEMEEPTDETPAETDESDADDSKEAAATLHDTVTRSADVLADLVKTMTRERVGLLETIKAVEQERDEAREQAKAANANLKIAKEIVQRIANSPLGRKAVYRDAVDDFNVRLSDIYSPEILKRLEKKDHVD